MWGVIAGLVGAGALVYLGKKKAPKGGVWVIGFQAPIMYPNNEIVWRNIMLEMGWDSSRVIDIDTKYADGINYVNVAFASDYRAEMPKVGDNYTIAGAYSKVTYVQRQPGNV